MRLLISNTFIFWLMISLGSATTVVPMSVERLTQVSSHVVEGQSVDTWSEWNPQHTQIYTYTKFQVTRALKGQSPAMMVVKQLGGTVGPTKQKVYGERYVQPGEQAVLFLRPAEELDGSMVISGLMQGNFAVRTSANGEKVVSNGVREVSAYSVGTGEISKYRGNTMRVEELRSRVQKAAEP
jgi:hypothetical protein